MTTYIYQLPQWPNFFWDAAKLAPQLSVVYQQQGLLMGTMQALGFDTQNETMLKTLTLDVLKSSEIEGEILNASAVRSSIARRLGITLTAYVKPSKNIDGVVAMILDATQHFDKPLTADRLFDWNINLLASDMKNIYTNMGMWRDDAYGPIQVVSGAISRERVHFEAPPAVSLLIEMEKFLAWANHNENSDNILKSAIAHLWFVTLHPFEDGNGRIARAISDYFLAKSEKSAKRFYSISAQICQARKSYYAILEKTQKGNLDITAYLEWFLSCLLQAFDETQRTIKLVLNKTRFWEQHTQYTFNDRQRLLLNKLFEGFKGKLTTSKWATIAKCSQDTALRDIAQLIDWNILIKDPAGGRSTSYSLK